MKKGSYKTLVSSMKKGGFQVKYTGSATEIIQELYYLILCSKSVCKAVEE